MNGSHGSSRSESTSPGVVEVARQATLEVSSGLVGCPPSLFSSDSGDSGQREGFRRYLHSTLSAYGKNGRGRAVLKARW